MDKESHKLIEADCLCFTRVNTYEHYNKLNNEKLAD